MGCDTRNQFQQYTHTIHSTDSTYAVDNSMQYSRTPHKLDYRIVNSFRCTRFECMHRVHSAVQCIQTLNYSLCAPIPLWSSTEKPINISLLAICLFHQIERMRQMERQNIVSKSKLLATSTYTNWTLMPAWRPSSANWPILLQYTDASHNA